MSVGCMLGDNGGRVKCVQRFVAAGRLARSAEVGTRHGRDRDPTWLSYPDLEQRSLRVRAFLFTSPVLKSGAQLHHSEQLKVDI